MLSSCVHPWYYSIDLLHINSDSFNFVLLSLSMIHLIFLTILPQNDFFPACKKY